MITLFYNVIEYVSDKSKSFFFNFVLADTGHFL